MHRGDGPDLTASRCANSALRRDPGRFVRVLEREGQGARARALAAHWEFLRGLLDEHARWGEEHLVALLGPSARGEGDAAAAVRGVLGQVRLGRARLAVAARRAGDALAAWAAGTARGPARALDALVRTDFLTQRHVTFEDEHLLPLVAALVPAEAWAACDPWPLGPGVKVADPGTGARLAEVVPWLLEDASAEDTRVILTRLPSGIGAGHVERWRARYAERTAVLRECPAVPV
jgi:hypothetical protein